MAKKYSMVNIDILEYENLRDCVKGIISAMLPHENYDAKQCHKVLRLLERYLKPDEINMEYNVLYSIIKEINRLGLMTNTVPKITEFVFEQTLQSNIDDCLKDYSVGFQSWAVSQGYNLNPEIEGNYEEMRSILYNRTMDLYDECMQMHISADEALSLELNLSHCFLMAMTSVRVQNEMKIIHGRVKLGGRYYSGVQDSHEYAKTIMTEIGERINEDSTGLQVVDSMDKVKVLTEKQFNAFIPIAKYGIPMYDDATPMLRHRFVILAANENVGKTTVSIDWFANLILEGRKVLYMYGESTDNQLFAKVKCAYIYKKYGKRVTLAHLSGIAPVTEDIQLIINEVDILFAGGQIILKNCYSYENFYEEASRDYLEADGFDAMILDHSSAFIGTGSDYENKSALAVQIREFKKNFPVCVVLLSHLSSLAKELVGKGKYVDVSPTKGSSTLSAEADEVFILIDNKTLQEQNCLMIENYKRREAAKVQTRVVITKMFDVCCFKFEENKQNILKDVEINTSAIINQLADTFDDESDDDFDEQF